MHVLHWTCGEMRLRVKSVQNHGRTANLVEERVGYPLIEETLMFERLLPSPKMVTKPISIQVKG